MHASDTCPDKNTAVPATANNKEVLANLLSPRLGDKLLSEGSKGAFVSRSCAISEADLQIQRGDFYLGLTCTFLLVIGRIIINRPSN